MRDPDVQVRLATGSWFTVAFTGEQLTVGRDNRCDVQIEDPFLSRKHLALRRENDQILVEDLKSRNGTYLNGWRITKAEPFSIGDVVELNHHRLTLLPDEDPTTGTNTIWKNATDVEDFTSVSSGKAPLRERQDPGQDAARLRLVNEIHEAFSGSEDEQSLLRLLVERSCDELGAETGDVFLRRADGGYQRAASTAGAHKIPYSRGLLRGVCEDNQIAVIPDLLDVTSGHAHESLVSTGIRSLVAVPLPGDPEVRGMLVLGSWAPSLFADEDLNLLSTLASVAGLKIRHTRLVQEAAKRQEELDRAREVQESLIPSELPGIEGFDLYVENLPSLGVSGDSYKVVGRQNGREWILLVVDVSGKGMPAALLTASVDALVEGPIEIGLDSATICERVSRRLFNRTPPHRYATAFLALLDVIASSVQFTNAGHVPAVVVRTNGSVEELRSTGPPLGLIPGARFQSGSTFLSEGDLVAIVSDGLTEAESPDEEEFGLIRLQNLLVRGRDLELGQLAKRIGFALNEFTAGAGPTDDRTLLLVRRTPGASSR